MDMSVFYLACQSMKVLAQVINLYLVIVLPCQPAESCHLRSSVYCTIFNSDNLCLISCFSGVETEPIIHLCCWRTLAVVRCTLCWSCSKLPWYQWPLWLPGRRRVLPIVTICGHAPWTDGLMIVANQTLPELGPCIGQLFFWSLSLISQSSLYRAWRSMLPDHDQFAQVLEATKL